MERASARPWAVVLALAAGACSGSIDGGMSGGEPGNGTEPGGSGSTGSGPGAPGGGSTPSAPPAVKGATSYAPAQVARLTFGQYVTAIRDLLGDAAANAAALEVWDESASEADHRFRTMRAAASGFEDLAVERLDRVAFAVAGAAFENPTARASLVGCTPTAPDGDCSKTYVGRLARRAFRRALAPAELAAYVGLVVQVAKNENGDVWRGLEAATATVLEAPSFLYRVEVGERDPANAMRLRYTGYEMAGRLAAVLWNSVPDDALLNAAEGNALAGADGVRAQAERLLKDARAARGVAAFASDLFEADRLAGITKDATAFTKFTPLLAAAMREEIERTVADMVVTQDADFTDLYVTKSTFVNDVLASLYGVANVKGADFRLMPLPSGSPRTGAGALGFAGFLAVHAGALEGSPIKRGVFLNERTLCREFGQPPAEAMMAGVQPDASGVKRTLRQRVEATTSPPNCAACHDRINPLGYGLESFDAIGAARTKDNGLPIDASGNLDGVAFDSAATLARAIHDNASATTCLPRQVYRFATGHLEDDSEQPVLDAITARFQSTGRHARQLFGDLVASDGFRYARAN